MKTNKILNLILIIVFSISFIFIFFSFVYLRWGVNDSENLAVIAIDLVRVILIGISIALNYILNTGKYIKYTPTFFTVVIFGATIFGCDFSKENSYIKVYQILNASYVALEVSCLLLANSFSWKKIDEKDEKIKNLIQTISENETKIRNNETKLLVNGNLIKKYENIEKENEQLIKDSKHCELLIGTYIEAIEFLGNTLVTQGHDFYILNFEGNKKQWELKKISQKETNKPMHLIEKLS